MSWDVLLFKAPPEVVSIGIFPKDFSSNLGPREGIVADIAGVLPDLDLNTPGWGFLDRGDYYIEIGFGDVDPVSSVALHIRGSENSISVIRTICEHTGWNAFDLTTGAFIQFNHDPALGYRKWKAARDKFASSLTEKKTGLRDGSSGRSKLVVKDEDTREN